MNNQRSQKDSVPNIFFEAATTTPQPLDFILPGLVAGTVGALISPGGTGKSMLALQIALEVAAGGGGILKMLSDDDLWGGCCKSGKVLYLAAEDPVNALHIRIRSVVQTLDIDPESIRDNVDIAPLPRAVNVHDNKDFEWMMRRGEGCRLIILDTLRRFHISDENSGGEMVQLVNKFEMLAKNTGAAVLFLHHASKSAALNGQGGMQQASRGSSVLVDNIRFQLYLRGMSAEDAKRMMIASDQRHQYVELGTSKINYSYPMPPIWLQRSRGGVLRPACITVKTQRKAQQKQSDDDGIKSDVPFWMGGVKWDPM